MTIDYYNENADTFHQRTVGRNLDHLYKPFLALLPASARILDAGCGQGRDSVAFIERGYQVTSIDASSAMVELARRVTGRPVQLLMFEQIDFHDRFDGVWASASLLHVPARQIDDVLDRLIAALKTGGVMYTSVKIGQGERIHDDGRFFCDYTQPTLREVLSRHPALELIEIRESPPSPNQTDGKSWLHALVRKVEG